MDDEADARETTHRLHEFVVGVLRAGATAQRNAEADDALFASVEEFLAFAKDPRVAMLLLAKGAGEVLDVLAAQQGVDVEAYLESIELKIFGDRYLKG